MSNGLSHLTGRDCGALLERLTVALQRAGVDLKRLALWDDLADVRWLTAFDCSVLRESGGPHDIEPERTVQGFMDAVFVKRTVVAVERASSLRGFDAEARHLRNWRLRPPTLSWTDGERDRADQAADHLYEMEIAARLAETFSDVRFEEPDLMVVDPETDFRFSIACKRPRTLKSLARATRRAVGQVRQQGVAGVVLVSADNLVDQMVRDLSGASLRGECQRRVGEVVAACSGAILQKLALHPPVREGRGESATVEGVLGVVVTGLFLLLGRDGQSGPSFLNTAFVPAMVNKNEPTWARQVLWALLGVVQQGEDALIART